MNDNVQNMIGISAILALFLSACFLALGLTRQIDGALDEVSAVVSGQKRSVHSTLTLARPDIFSGSQAFLVTVDQVGAGVAVKVDGVPVASGDPLELAGTAVRLSAGGQIPGRICEGLERAVEGNTFCKIKAR
ncbi:hypothetical protein VQ056_11035 [Paenibacillus sp. JTLBN-2024]